MVAEVREKVNQGVDENDILLLSFTRSAASVLAHRAGLPRGRAATLHSCCFRLLGLTRDQVVDAAKLRQFSKVSKVEITQAGPYDEEQQGKGDRYLAAIKYSRASGCDPEKAFHRTGCDGYLAEFVWFWDHYEKWKAANGYTDFDDMIEDGLKTRLDADVLFLDEAQDFSKAQWDLLNTWIEGLSGVVVAGDDDQAVHEWAGAVPEGMHQFEKNTGAERVVLDQSYRLPVRVLENARRFSESKIPDRVHKDFYPVDAGGRLDRHSNFNSVSVPGADEDCLVLFRNHTVREDAERWLQDRCVPYLTESGTRGPLQDRLAHAVRALLKAQENYRNIGVVGLGDRQVDLLHKSCLPQFRKRAKDQNQLVSLLGYEWHQVLAFPKNRLRFHKRLAAKFGTPVPGSKVRLMTVHASKGQEADRVVLINSMSTRTSQTASKNPAAEARVWYVGMTRARHELDVVMGENAFGGV